MQVVDEMSRTRPLEDLVCDILRQYPEGLIVREISEKTGIPSRSGEGRDSLCHMLKRMSWNGRVRKAGFRDKRTVWAVR